MNNKISVVIAAYNEEPRIANVLKVVERHPLINEVIVVDDGSNDNTSDVVKKYDVTLIKNQHNLGKTLSVKKGIEAAKNDLIMMLDADLIGLDGGAINELAKPVLDGDVDWTLSLRGNSFRLMKLAKIDWVSGERVVPKQLLLDNLIWSRPDIGYGLEALMNKSLLGKNKTFRSVYLADLTIAHKSDKVGWIKGIKQELRMIFQIAKVVPMHQFLWQFVQMSRLNRKYTAR